MEKNLILIHGKRTTTPLHKTANFLCLSWNVILHRMLLALIKAKKQISHLALCYLKLPSDHY